MGVEFGRRFKELREAKKLTQAELARLCNLGESTISFYETGKREPNYNVLLLLAEKLETTPNYLLTGKNEESSHSWWEKDVLPGDIELGDFIRDNSNLRIFGDPLSEDVKADVMLALRTAWEVLKKERAAKMQPKGQ